MRLRLAVLVCTACSLVLAALPGAAAAAPRHNHGLTINAIPNPIQAGEGVIIYGRLNVPPVAGRKIVLYHRIAGQPGFTVISTTITDARGFYAFTRAEGIVLTNRRWFVREAGEPRAHSRTVFERVAALVNLSESTGAAVTRQAVTFSGQVTPGHASQRVLLQKQVGSRDEWRTIKVGRLGANSRYSFLAHFRIPGAYAIRAVFPRDRRNVRGVSDPVSIVVQQRERPDFTIQSSAPIIDEGQSATLTGVLYAPNTHSPLPNAPVTLCARSLRASGFTCDTTSMTGSDGSYKFDVTPVYNTVYLVRSTLHPHRHTAHLFEGVRDVLNLTASSSTSTVGGSVTFGGTAMPDKVGDPVYLQRLGGDAEWHTVAVSTVQPGSKFSFVHTFGTAGTKTFRARIPGDGLNIGGASNPVAVTVSLPLVSSLPPAS